MMLLQQVLFLQDAGATEDLQGLASAGMLGEKQPPAGNHLQQCR